MAVETAGHPLMAGLKPVDPAFESWWVRPGSATVVDLHGDDRVTVIDPDGGQPAELTVLAPDGREDAAAIGATADAPATVVRDLVAAGNGHAFLEVSPRARPAPPRRARAPPVRGRQPSRRLAGVPRRARRGGDRGSTGRPRDRR